MRELSIEGAEWVAWTSGGGAYGTGNRGLGAVEAIHFAPKSAPDRPVLEGLAPAGRFQDLYDEELLMVFRNARKVVEASELPAAPVHRRNLAG